MLSVKKSITNKFETTADEIMNAGAKAIEDMIHTNPALILITDELTSLVAATAAIWSINLQKNEGHHEDNQQSKDKVMF